MADLSELVYKTLTNEQTRAILDEIGELDFVTGPWVSGGSVRKMWHDLSWAAEDIDYFFSDVSQFAAFADNIKQKYDLGDIEKIELTTSESTSMSILSKAPAQQQALPFYSCYITPNANTYTIAELHDIDEVKVQAIKKYYPTSLRELFDSFDFTVCQFATDGKILVATRAALEDVANNQLRMIPNTARSCTAARLTKYTAYGFEPTNEMMLTTAHALVNCEDIIINDTY